VYAVCCFGAVFSFLWRISQKPHVIVARGIDAPSRPSQAPADAGGLDGAMPRANLRLRLLGKNARAAVEHLFARA
jgi:hypothetical protein